MCVDARLQPWMIRVLAFVRKDVVEIIHQPQLLLGVVLGPFILLLVFGASLGDLAPELETVVVVQRDSALFNLFQQFRFNPSGRFEISEVTPAREDALERLRNGEIDIVLALPNEPQQTIRRGEPAEAILYHNFIDPLEARAIGTATQLSVGELNESFVAELLRDAQRDAVDGRDRLDRTLAAVRLLRTSLEDGDVARARRAVPQVRRNLAAARLLLAPVTAAAATGAGDAGSTPLNELDRTLVALDRVTAVADPATTDTQRLAAIERDLEQAQDELDAFTSLSPEVAISPLTSRVERVQGGSIGLPAFYAPAVLVLLGQHLLITTVALATVQEEQYGTIELFAVAPLKPFERLLGRYGGALALAVPTMTLMVGLLVGGLGVPMLGSWLLLAAVIVALLLTSIGIGFLIAELSSSTTQAVQMAMGVLLASVFFSGFVLSTQFFVGVGKLVGLLLPATYAIQAMRDVMLRGEILRTSPYIVLPAAAAMLFIVNWALLRREAGKPALPALVSGVGEGTVSVVRTSGRTIERALRWGRRSGSHRPRDEA
jgi:ABC-2 type transport system permease protein